MRAIKQRKPLHKQEKKMKKLLVSLVLVGGLVAVIGATSVARAQGPVDQPLYQQGGGQYGYGANDPDHVENEDVHELMMNAYSAELGISVEELEAREAAGETMFSIVTSTGRTFEEFRAFKTAVHTTVAEQALAAGYITQAQADWMLRAADRQMGAQGGGAGMRGAGNRSADGTGFGGGMRRSGLRSTDCTTQP